MICKQVLSLQAATASGGDKSPEEIVDDLAADILAKVPQPYDVEAASQTYPVMYEDIR